MEEFSLLAFILLLGLGAWWAFSTFPRQRAFTKRQKFARSLTKGDEIITFGGIIGKVIDIDAQKGIAHVEISDGIIIRLLNAAMMQPYDAEEIAQNAQQGWEDEQ